MNCKNCGAVVQEGEDFCSNCGEIVESNKENRIEEWKENIPDKLTDKVYEGMEKVGISKNNITANEDEFDSILKSMKWPIYLAIESSAFATLIFAVKGDYLIVLLCLITVIDLICFYNLTKKKKVIGPIFGIALVVIYVVFMIFIKLIILLLPYGLYILKKSIAMYNYLKKENIDE